ncbi:hypothetical protein [Actinoplanes palleronii]|uniref:Uncharacterized protein n=1 Tax=Actinoplanes palleronii TaxID=113570 RepID=A0ABQ4BFM5_9ACTN|nr:hypothetical protein [Actinoplanes palleronii]GIE69452.1 hypothetical protein Apa02nite_055600 [Actinoplanes palleronii]
MHRSTNRFAAAALAVGCGLGAAVGLSGPALAASCQLDFARPSTTVYRILLNCTGGTPTSISLYAEDFPFDQFLGNFLPGQLVDQGTLNEDDFPFNREDEIHGQVAVREANGTVVSVRTNTVNRNF